MRPGILASTVVLLAGMALRAATFGAPVSVTGGPLDLVLDEKRNQLYLVDFNTNQVRVYSIAGRRFLPPIPVGMQPAGAAISRDAQFLYVTNFGGSSLSVIDLDQSAVLRTVTLPARPEGVAVGGDGRVLITTLGSGPVGAPQDTLLIFHPDASGAGQIVSVSVPPPPPAPPQLPPQIPGRIYLSFRGRLEATRDGRFIIGLNTPANNNTVVFVYEAASGQVLRSRSVPGISTVLSVSPDGRSFMAGLRLFDTATLNVLAQFDANNAPFPLAGNFNLLQNVGGSVFSPDGSTLYGAFNVAPLVTGGRPNSTTLLITNPRNLAVRLGIQLPESILGKIVSRSDGRELYALSETGLLLLPVATLDQFPILMPETEVIRLTGNQCDRIGSSAVVRIQNAGRGVLRFTVAPPPAAAGLLVQAQGQQPPASVRFTMNLATPRRVGTTTTQVTLQSQEAINIPPAIRVFQNWLNAETRATTIPVPVVSEAEGLADLLVDDERQRVYVANSGKNQVEVFDMREEKFREPIEVGQFPRSLAFSTDRRTLYVANSGGEWISMVDLGAGREYDRIRFPPAPFGFAQGPFTPRVIAQGLYGLQIFASTAANTPGTLWSASTRTAVPRNLSGAIGAPTLAVPVSMAATPGNEAIMVLAGTGIAYLYDSLSDDYVLGRTVMNAPLNSFYGTVAAGPQGRYFLANRAILNSTLVPTGGFTGGAGTPGPPLPPTPGPAPGPAPGPVPRPDGQPGAGQQEPGQQPEPEPSGPFAELRNVPAMVAVDANTFARFSTAPQATATAQPTGDPQPKVELIDIRTERVLDSVPLSEGPSTAVFGAARVNVAGRLMGVDARATRAYVITASGLSVAEINAGLPPVSVTVNRGGVVNAASFGSDIAPGSLISIFGQTLAGAAAAGSLPLPSVLGGSCVTLNDVALPLVMTSPGQINAQVPPNFRPGTYPLVVRSLDRAVAGAASPVRIVASAPAIFFNPATGDAALFHAEDLSPVTRQSPARRDEVLVLFATGMPPAAGVTLQPGEPSPADPPATTARPKVFIGDPRIREAEMIVEWSGFAPGFVGLNQINIRVHGDRIRGDRLPVSILIGTVSSPLAGQVPVTYVR